MGEAKGVESLVALLAALEDPRIDRTKSYPLEEILFLVLAAVLSGVNHVVEISRFGSA